MQKPVFIFALLFGAMLALIACSNNDPIPAPTTVATTVATATVTALAPTAMPSTTPLTAQMSLSTTAPTLVPMPTAVPTPNGDPAHGKALFAITCSACHGPTGEGVKGLGKDMTTSKFIASLSDADLLAFVKKGRLTSDPLNTTGVAMPPKGGNPALIDEQLMDIIAYIRSIHKPNAK